MYDKIINKVKVFDSYCKDRGICLEEGQKYYCIYLLCDSEMFPYREIGEMAFMKSDFSDNGPLLELCFEFEKYYEKREYGLD